MRWLALVLALLLPPQAFAGETQAPEAEAHGETEAVKEPVKIEDILRPPAGAEFLATALTRLQDATAQGNAEAGPLQRKMLAELSRALRTHDRRTLPSQRMLRAAIIYLLSGGRARDVETLLAATPETDPLRWLLKGAAHYAANEKEQALKIFMPFNPELLPVSIGGRIALARAMVLPDEQLAERIRLLRLAGRMMPGTLIEESSLRRLAAIAASLSEPAPLQHTVERYLGRYRNSIYGADVIGQYSKAIVAFEQKRKPADRRALEQMFNGLPGDLRRDAYLDIAKAATMRGLADLALFSATRARRLAAEGSDAWHNATLFDAAILITGPDYEIAREILAQIDAARLDDSGRELLAATLRIAESIRRPEEPQVPRGGEALEAPAEQAQLLGKAEKVISATDDILKGLTQ